MIAFLVVFIVIVLCVAFYNYLMNFHDKLAKKIVKYVIKTYNKIFKEDPSLDNEALLALVIINSIKINNLGSSSIRYELYEVCSTIEGTCYLYAYLKYLGPKSTKQSRVYCFRAIDNELFKRGIQLCSEMQKFDLYNYFGIGEYFEFSSRYSIDQETVNEVVNSMEEKTTLIQEELPEEISMTTKEQLIFAMQDKFETDLSDKKRILKALYEVANQKQKDLFSQGKPTSLCLELSKSFATVSKKMVKDKEVSLEVAINEFKKYESTLLTFK